MVTITNETLFISRRAGRPPGSKINNDNRSPSNSSLKRKRESLINELSYSDGILCAKKKFKETNNHFAAKIIDIIKDPAKAKQIFELYVAATSKDSILTPEEALALLSLARLTKESYLAVREIFLKVNINALPSYHKVIDSLLLFIP